MIFIISSEVEGEGGFLHLGNIKSKVGLLTRATGS